MFWFNPIWLGLDVGYRKFKYILCFGSTAVLIRGKKKGAIFKYILCFGSTFVALSDTPTFYTFKYILCFGST